MGDESQTSDVFTPNQPTPPVFWFEQSNCYEYYVYPVDGEPPPSET